MKPTKEQIELAESNIRSFGGDREGAYMSALNADRRNKYEDAVVVYVPWKNSQNPISQELEKMNNEYIEANIETLKEYWAENIAEGVLDDDMSDAFDSWIGDTSFKDLRDIILNAHVG